MQPRRIETDPRDMKTGCAQRPAPIVSPQEHFGRKLAAHLERLFAVRERLRRAPAHEVRRGAVRELLDDL